MSETLAPVVPIRPGLTDRHGDMQAMDDIHALVTSAIQVTGEEVAACITEIVARTGRRLDPARTITAEMTSQRPAAGRASISVQARSSQARETISIQT